MGDVGNGIWFQFSAVQLTTYLFADPPRDDSAGGGGGRVEPNPEENPLKAAIVYVHGESFEWNAGNLYDGTMLAAHGDVIVVTINFRLGILGKFVGN